MPGLKILIYVSIFSVFLPITFLFRKSKMPENSLTKALGLLLIISPITDLINYTLGKIEMPSLIVANLCFILQFLLLNYIFTLLLSNKKIVYTGALLFVIFTLYNFLRIQNFTEYQDWPYVTGSIMLLTYSLLYMWQLIIAPPAQNIWQFSPFWINTAVLWYFSLFLMINYVFKNFSTEIAMVVWVFHNINNIVKNILLAVGIYYSGEIK
ncbi:MAG TPA: hypothetical protein VFN30_11715 [Chitinophagaceae bacterium]|nr:hypothetical protein [Chitinophagaceae bacterium]